MWSQMCSWSCIRMKEGSTNNNETQWNQGWISWTTISISTFFFCLHQTSIQLGLTERKREKPQENQSDSATIVERSEEKGSLLLRELLEWSKHCDIDVRVIYLSQPSYINKCLKNIFKKSEKRRRKVI